MIPQSLEPHLLTVLENDDSNKQLILLTPLMACCLWTWFSNPQKHPKTSIEINHWQWLYLTF